MEYSGKGNFDSKGRLTTEAMVRAAIGRGGIQQAQEEARKLGRSVVVVVKDPQGYDQAVEIHANRSRKMRHLKVNPRDIPNKAENVFSVVYSFVQRAEGPEQAERPLVEAMHQQKRPWMR